MTQAGGLQYTFLLRRCMQPDAQKANHNMINECIPDSEMLAVAGRTADVRAPPSHKQSTASLPYKALPASHTTHCCTTRQAGWPPGAIMEARLRALFSGIDADGNGVLSREELSGASLPAFPYKPLPASPYKSLPPSPYN